MSPDLIEGALIAVGAFLAGQWLPRPHRRRPRPPKPVKPVCGCGHHHSYHDPATGECHSDKDGARIPILDERGRPVMDSDGDVQTTRERILCGCRQYSGPTPLPEFYAPEISQ